MAKHITDREKAVLFALAAGYIKTWNEAFILSYPDTEEKARSLKKVSSSVTHWKNHPTIVQAFKEVSQYVEARDQLIKDDAIKKASKDDAITKEDKQEAGSERPGPKASTKVDYSDPEARRKLYNEIILKSADDPKTQLDAAKVIEQTQRDDKQAARERKTVVFFTPQRCLSCELYLKAQKKAAKG